jgi:hypothetical protein
MVTCGITLLELITFYPLPESVKKGNTITYSSNKGNRFVVRKLDGTIRIFGQFPSGLFYLDTEKIVSKSVFINTVDNNKSNYTDKDNSQALLARRIQRMIRTPSTQHFLHVVDNNLLRNYQTRHYCHRTHICI